MATVSLKYLEAFDFDTDVESMERLDLALELTYICNEDLASDLLGSIESVLDSLDQSDPI